MKPVRPWSASLSISRPVWILLAVTLLLAAGVGVARRLSREPAPGTAVRPPVPGLTEGNAAFERREWTAAVEFYRIALEQDEDNAAVWGRLGFALHVLQRYDEAIEAHRSAARYEETRPTALYNLACALARLNRRDEALAALREAIDANFRHRRSVLNDPDFARLRDDAEFRQLARRATTTPPGPPTEAESPPPLEVELPVDWLPPSGLPRSETIGS